MEMPTENAVPAWLACMGNRLNNPVAATTQNVLVFI
jgi:hypothetical protein